MTLRNKKMSTYVNTLAETGFKVEKIVEESDWGTLKRDKEYTSTYYAPTKAKKFPLSFIVKARKL